jgi:hypothetical protein
MPKTTPLTLTELSEFLPRLQATVELLAGEAATAKQAARHTGARVTRGAARGANGAAAAKGKGRRGRRGRMTAQESARLRQQILGALSSKKGLALGEVVKRTGGDRNAVGFQLRRLRSEKKARVVGDRQLARWFAR